MKNKVEKIVVLIFIITMCFLMSISAHAETERSYFFGSSSLPTRISLDGVTITPTNISGQVSSDSRTIFNKSVSHYARVRSDQNKATKFTIETQSKGVLLVYYTRQFGGNGPVANDNNDLNIVNVNGVAEYCQKETSPCQGVKYYVLNANTSYTMTTSGNTCGVYGFVYMPGNVAAYDTKGKGDLSLIGQCCEGSYNNLPVLEDDNCTFGGWYKDEAYTEKVTEGTVITEPTVLFARWTRYVWDFTSYYNGKINSPIMYDGIVIKGSDMTNSTIHYSVIGDYGINFLNAPTKDYEHIEFTPEYDGELIVTYRSSASSTDVPDRICVIGTDIITGSDINDLRANPNVLACGAADYTTNKTLNAKLRKGTKCYIYSADGRGIYIPKMQYVASAASAVENGSNVTLTTTANMQGWRAFYDATNSYTVDDNTNVYIAVATEGDNAVRLSNMTGKKVPVGCPVILHTDNVLEDGTYQITMTKDAMSYVYDGKDNLLHASGSGVAVDAYRLGYRSGDGIAFYPWKADTPSDGIVYLDLSNSGNAKITFEVEEGTTGIFSVQNEQNEGEAVFNLNGQRMDAPRKGFNIINGKKVIVR